MNKLIQNLENHFNNAEIVISDKAILKKIVSHLNKKWIIIVSWLIGSNKLWVVKGMILKTKMDSNFFYYNGEVDITHSITSQKELSKIYESQKIIILEDISHIDKAEDFIHSEFKKWNKIILIGNALHIKWVKEIEILPDSHSYQNNPDLFAHKIITQDIYIKQKLKNFPLLDHTLKVIAQSHELISVREIHKILTKQGSKISQITLIEYINYILDSKLIKKIFRYDLKTNKISTWKAKYLFTDTFLRNSIVSNQLSQNIINENNIFQLLERQWYKILTWKNWTFDFSFITTNKKRDNVIIHVSDNIEKNEVKKEAKKLLKIPWDYTKYLLVDSIKEVWIRPSTYLPLQIMEIEEFLKTKK